MILQIRTDIVKRRLTERNIMLNDSKTVECVSQTDFLGFNLTSNGVRISQEKLQAIREFREPQSAEEVRSFLGLVTFVSRHIPNLSTIANPLVTLTKKNTIFNWTAAHQKAFELLKTSLLKEETLAYFDPELETFVVTDASPVGLGAVLFQKTRSGEYNIISYASKTLSDVEKRYAQTEREALALVWAPEKFHFYLYGKFFWLITDHKPLVTIFGDRSKPCARIDRWKLRLMSYDYKVIYRPGKSNIADPLSRMCQNQTLCPSSYDEESERIVRLISSDVSPVAIPVIEIIEATKKDLDLLELIKWLPYPHKRWPKTLARYRLVANDLSTDGQIILKNQKIVIPRSLQKKILQLAHEPHLGIDAMKRRLREKVWWVRIDTMVDSFVKECHGCLLVSQPSVEPMTRIEMPSKPWRKIAIDFMEVLNGIHLLVAVDYHSRFPEIEIMTSTTANLTIFRLRTIFSRYGFPEEIVCDNGPPFQSEEFKDYCTSNDIRINHSIPYAPFQNGLVERQNRTLLKTIRISVAMGRDWKNDLYSFLLAYRNTPHSITGKSPAVLMFGRTLKDKLPEALNTQEDEKDVVTSFDQIKKDKGKQYGDFKRKAKYSEIDVGDTVLLKNQMKKNKLTTNFNPQPNIVLRRNGTRLTVKDLKTGAESDRHVNHAKRITSSSPFQNSETAATEDLFDPNQNKASSDPKHREEDGRDDTSRITKKPRRERRMPEYLKDYNINEIDC